jgi:hypothetical protein
MRRSSRVLVTYLLACLSACAVAHAAPVPVTVRTFARAETDRYFKDIVALAGLGRFRHVRTPISVDSQTVIRMNRDTFYSSAVFDLDAGPVTVTLPDGGGRFMSLMPVNEDHYAYPVAYGPGKFTFTRKQLGTRYAALLVRTFADPNDAKDVAAARVLQDQIRVEQPASGKFEVPDWDKASLDKLRETLLVLGSMEGEPGVRFGRKGEVDPVSHLIGTAGGWGGNPNEAAVYDAAYPAANDGVTVHRLTVKDVPVDGFWSITVYNADGFMQKNDLGVYSLNNVTAKHAADGSYTIQFGGCGPGVDNCVPVFKGWNYLVRMYRPRKPILDGTWKFPKPEPVR